MPRRWHRSLLLYWSARQELKACKEGDFQKKEAWKLGICCVFSKCRAEASEIG